MCPFGFSLWIRYRYRIEQCAGIRVSGVVEQLIAFGKFHQFPEIHHCNAIGYVAHDAEIVGDEEVGEIKLLAQVLKQVDYLRLDRYIQR